MWFQPSGQFIRPTLTMTLALASLSVSFQGHSETLSLKTDLDKASYAIGLKYGQSMQQEFNDLNYEVFQKGFAAGYAGDKALLSDAETQSVLTNYQKQRQEKLQSQQEAAAAANLAAGEAFLAANAKKDDIQLTDTGLQYQIIKAGKGAQPKLTDKVKVHYHGTLIDGTVFDSSIERGDPVSFPVNGVIPGWTEALQMMKEGSEWMLYIPAELAYGQRAASAKIGPNSTLIFKVQLLEVMTAS